MQESVWPSSGSLGELQGLYLQLPSLWVAPKRLLVQTAFVKETESLQFQLPFKPEYFILGVLSLAWLNLWGWLGQCPRYIHLCEYSVRIVTKVLRQPIETGFLEELSRDKG